MSAPPITIMSSSLLARVQDHDVFVKWCFELRLGCSPIVSGLGPMV
jgi:hypothetical protein